MARNFIPLREEYTSDREFVLETLKEHRESHQYWIDHLASGACPNCPDLALLGSIEEQQHDVKRYDQLIAIIEPLLNAKPQQHEGDHEFQDGNCRKCVASYCAAEERLDTALATCARPKEIQ